MFEPLYQWLFHILDSTNGYSTTSLLAGILVGGPMLFALFMISIATALPPGKQINYVFNYISKQRSTAQDKKIAKDLNKAEESRRKNEQKHEWIEISYRRLGKTLGYDDFLADSKNMGFMIFMVSATLAAVMYIMTKDVIMLIPFLGIGVMGILFGDVFTLMLLQSKIKKLNFAQKVELPILMTRFQAVTSELAAHPFNRVLETYLMHAGAMKYDIEMCLADRRSYGDVQALTLWQKRVTLRAGSTMIEFTQFCERIKKLYTTGDSLFVKTELASDIRIIDTKYVDPYIKKQADNKLMKLLAIMLLAFMILACFFMLPMVIQIWEALKNVNM